MIMNSLILSMAMLGGAKFVELTQQVQNEYDWAPTVGRQAEPEPTPFVPIRYLTPEQRAQPIIVEPAPVIIPAPQEKQASSAPAQPTVDEYGIPLPTNDGTTPDYITSAPKSPPAPTAPVAAENASATGSTAIAEY